MADTGLVETLLRRVEKVDGGLDSQDVATSLGVDHQAIVGAVKSLLALGDVISAEQRSSKHWELTGEGCEIAEQGSHEARVVSSIPEEGMPQSQLMKLAFGKVGFSKAMSNNVSVAFVMEKLRMTHININFTTVKSYWITKGSCFSTTITKQETELTPEMIASGSWKEKKFKPYNFEALGVAPDCGHLHPLMKVRTQFRQIFLEMGFTEMPTNNFIESSFWNFDSLFQPQQHPARDQHDTFFLSDPAQAHEFPQDYLERVRKVHSEGGFGSQGYKYDWKIEEAQKNILRTHTTAVSARMLYKLAQQEKFTPVKYFSIDRVFRNETLDATHLAEFHQIEGVVADYGLTLGDLMGILHQFFNKLGITKLRFKPAYNPYTEPSMEVFSYHEGLKKWVEVGNSGMFRPEMLLPMGLPEGVTVIAWGLSLERPTMIKYGINNIRELVGHKVNLQMVYDSPVCRLDS
uniref:phenylalanine--tRNA ligase n=1 Tax=Oncorhynchus mykiss TaxID=8022 RepID=A0A8C7R0Y2_ONCMY